MHYFILPALFLSTWNNCTLNDVTCPSNRNEITGKMLNSGTIKLTQYSTNLLSGINNQITGTDCVKLQLKTTCISRIFTANTMTYEKLSKTPQLAECENLNQEININYPQPSCIWHPFNDNPNTVAIETISVKRSAHEIDMYTGLIKHKFQKFIKCDQKVCYYHGNKGIFIKDIQDNREGTDICGVAHYKLGEEIDAVILENGSGKMLRIKDKFIDSRDICNLVRCGQHFLYVKDHTLYQVQGQQNLFDNCKTNELTVEDNDSIVDKINHQTDCENVLYKLHNKGEISYRDLKILNPDTIGVHKVYNITSDKKLQCNIAYYTRVTLHDIKSGSYKEEWNNCGNLTKCSINGRTAFNSDTTDTHFILRNYEAFDDERTNDVIVSYKDTINITLAYESNTVHTQSTGIQLFNKLWIWIGEVVLLIILLIIILRCIVNNITKNKRIDGVYRIPRDWA